MNMAGNRNFIAYLKMARFDHWVKNLFVLPGVALGLSFSMTRHQQVSATNVVIDLALSMLGVGLVSSANYTINEWIDREFDKKHPYKNRRPATQLKLSPLLIYAQYLALAVTGIGFGFAASGWIGLYLTALTAMGLLYNVKPFRTKDLAYLDVLSESVNNPIRLSIGWHSVVHTHLVPASAFIAFWAAGSFLMALKRYSEMQIIKDKELMISYRKSFKRWNPHSLLSFAIAGGLTCMSFIGVLLTGYRLEYIILIPPLVGIFTSYLYKTLELNPMAHAPEKIWKEWKLQLQVAAILALGIILSFVDISVLHNLTGF